MVWAVVIEDTSGHANFIAAVLQKRTFAERLAAGLRLPSTLRAQIVGRDDVPSFPCLIVGDHRGLHLLRRAELLRHLRELIPAA